MATDAHGQPVSTRLRAASIKTRQIDELIGICRGILFDDKVLDIELERLFNWIDAQPGLNQVWPASIIHTTLQEYLHTKQKKAKLKSLIEALIGGELIEEINTKTGEITTATPSTALPLTNPEKITFLNKNYVLTGKFTHGTRSECQNKVKARGGNCQKTPTNRTDYLVIGIEGSRDWAHSSAGRKIQKAAMLKEAGNSIEIISEQQWGGALELIPPTD